MQPTQTLTDVDEIQLLQRRLARCAAFNGAISGVFDDATKTAIRLLQARSHLIVTGSLNPETSACLMTTNRPDPAARALSRADFRVASDALCVDVPAIRAIHQVESQNSGFLPSGRPAILFERHVFYRRLAALSPALANSTAAARADICSQMPGGYHGGDAEYMRLQAAETFAPSVAWESCSWGAFQIMGFHWKRLDYADASDFVDRMETNAAEQLGAFIRFVAADSTLLTALKYHNWSTFAKSYNGPNYKINRYDEKIEQAFKKWSALSTSL